MTAPVAAPRGLSAAELALALAELQSLCGRVVLDAVPLRTVAGEDDLLLVFDGQPKEFLLVAPGGTRARVGTTALRFARDERQRGVAADLCQRELVGATLMTAVATPGERRCAFLFDGPMGPRTLQVELFGARGFWAVVAADGTLLAQSREVVTAVRTLRPGDRYAPPPAATGPTSAEPEPRFAPPVLPAIDAHFAEQDRRVARRDRRETLERAAQRAVARASAKAAGLASQLADTGRAAAWRQDADLLLAYGHLARRGADRLVVPDPLTGEPRELALDPARPPHLQAQQLYEKARRFEDGRAMTEQRLAAAQREVATAAAAQAALAAAPPASDAPGGVADDDPQLALAQRLLEGLGALPRPPRVASPEPRRSKAPPPGENFRRFLSAEGYPILVGRNNEQNDRLTMKTANGNDLWLHVGGGRPGSHVVIRLPKGKTASLESLLDAAMLAVHFSKARGEPRVEVVYTQKKHVRKPKGLPAGAVVPSQTKTLVSLCDAERLRRLLDSSGGDVD